MGDLRGIALALAMIALLLAVVDQLKAGLIVLAVAVLLIVFPAALHLP